MTGHIAETKIITEEEIMIFNQTAQHACRDLKDD